MSRIIPLGEPLAVWGCHACSTVSPSCCLPLQGGNPGGWWGWDEEPVSTEEKYVNHRVRSGSLLCFQLGIRLADHPLLFPSTSVLGPRRLDGSRLRVGKGCPLIVIIGLDALGLSSLDAAAIGGTGAGTGLALATTARPNRRGQSRIFHVRPSPAAQASSAGSSRGRLGPRGARGKTPDSNCMKGISLRRGKHCANCV